MEDLMILLSAQTGKLNENSSAKTQTQIRAANRITQRRDVSRERRNHNDDARSKNHGMFGNCVREAAFEGYTSRKHERYIRLDQLIVRDVVVVAWPSKRCQRS